MKARIGVTSVAIAESVIAAAAGFEAVTLQRFDFLLLCIVFSAASAVTFKNSLTMAA